MKYWFKCTQLNKILKKRKLAMKGTKLQRLELLIKHSYLIDKPGNKYL